MEKIKNYLVQSKIEIDKVIFPTKDQIRNAFITVVVVVAVVSLFLAIIDILMSFVISDIV